jgi:hypothetical protein
MEAKDDFGTVGLDRQLEWGGSFGNGGTNSRVIGKELDDKGGDFGTASKLAHCGTGRVGQH